MDQKLLELVVCPITHSKLHLEGDELVSEIAGIRYPIRDGLPVLLPDAAKLPPNTTLDQLRAQRPEKRT
ncbi:MAG: Trm112 family protein [Phycisphaerae bacterium]